MSELQENTKRIREAAKQAAIALDPAIRRANAAMYSTGEALAAVMHQQQIHLFIIKMGVVTHWETAKIQTLIDEVGRAATQQATPNRWFIMARLDDIYHMASCGKAYEYILNWCKSLPGNSV